MNARQQRLEQIAGQLGKIVRERWTLTTEEHPFQAADSTATGGLAVALTGRPIMHQGGTTIRSYRTRVEYRGDDIVPVDEGGFTIRLQEDFTIFANARHSTTDSVALYQLDDHDQRRKIILMSERWKSGRIFRRKGPLQLLFEQLDGG